MLFFLLVGLKNANFENKLFLNIHKCPPNFFEVPILESLYNCSKSVIILKGWGEKGVSIPISSYFTKLFYIRALIKTIPTCLC